MATIMNHQVMSTGKIPQDDDAASTVSGASSDQVSLPSSPGASEMASLPTSPSQVSPDAALVTRESLADLPSVGSLGHFAGLCSRCCFHAKGRCQNGHDCRFCHFEHEKRPRKKKVQHNKVAGMEQAFVALNGFNENVPASLPSLVAPLLPPPGLETLPFEAMSMPPYAAPCMPPVLGLPTTSDVESWSTERVMDWLGACGLGHLSENFKEHRISGDVLLTLDSSDLEEIGIRAFGDKKRLLKGIGQLQSQAQVVHPGQGADQRFPCPPPPPPPPPSWEAPSFETHTFCALGPYPPPAPPPPSFMEFHQCPLPEPPSFNAPM